MPGSSFDTNVLVCIASGDAMKADRTEQLIEGGDAVSVQVLNEFANVARRKMQLTWQETHEFLSTIRALLRVDPITREIHDTGFALSERYGLSIFDAMIAASALHAQCDALWAGDMQHGMVIEGRLRIIDPSRAAA